MGKKLPIRRNGVVLGYTEELSSGDMKLFNRGNRLLGIYRKSPNKTYKGAGSRYYGDGNQLMALLEEG
mgnify:CR=1 FL=1